MWNIGMCRLQREDTIMVQCEKCGSKWEASSAYSKSLSACPFCGAMLLEEEKARGYGKMGEFLGYMVKVYGEELYRNPERLKNLIGDLYGGEERVKREAVPPGVDRGQVVGEGL